MTSFILKILAMIFMTIDHIGAVNPSFLSRETIMILRIIGRLSFPIFFFLMVEGFNHTSNIKKYIKSLYIFGLVSAIPFYIAFGTPLNVFFTLGSIVFMLHLLKNTENEKEKIKIFFTFLLLNVACDWGFVAIPVTYLIHKKIDDKKYLAIHIPLYTSIVAFFQFVIITAVLNSRIISIFTFSIPILFTIPILLAYNGKVGIKLTGVKKYFFYIYYPLHLIIIALLVK